MHIFDSRFPLAQSARRKERDAPAAEYRKVQQRLGLERVVVVQPTAYGKDNRCTLEAIAKLGESARGIAVVDNNVSDIELEGFKELIKGIPERLVRTSNWRRPSSGSHGAPDHAMLLDVLLDWPRDADTRNRILADNPAQLYGFGSS
jgi:predicted TIM-barrel fold metal-dependent hydrolase